MVEWCTFISLAMAEFPAPTDELASARLLRVVELRLATELSPRLLCRLATLIRALMDALALILASAERNARKPCPILVARSRWVLSKDPDGGSASIHALHNGNAVEHGTGRSVPFGEHEHVTLAEGINIWG